MPTASVAAASLRSRRTALTTHAGFFAVLTAFCVVVLPTLSQGIGNLDSHRILISVQSLVDEHRVLATRQPGHPTTSFYIFGGAGWLLRHGLGRPFDAKAYCTLQWLLALAAGGIFYLWLLRSGFMPGRAALATACLMFSPQFLLQTLDGEEFIAGLLLLLGAMLVLLGRGAEPPTRGRIACSAVLFALATGCRAELVFAGVGLFPLCFLLWRIRNWKLWVGTALGVTGAVVIVWLPILLTEGLHNPDPAMSAGQSFLAWGYKLLFLCFGFPTSLVLFGVVAFSAMKLRRQWPQLGPADYSCVASLVLATLLLGLYIFHPHKPAIGLNALPFLLALAARRKLPVLVGVAGLTLMNLLVSVEIFRDRILTAPYLSVGGFRRATESKPANQLGYIRALAATPVETTSAIVGDVFSWVYDHHRARGTFPAPRAHDAKGEPVGYATADPNRILLPREAIMFPETLHRLHQQGYRIVVDRLLWRTLFARYDVTSPVGDTASIGALPVRLITVHPAP